MLATAQRSAWSAYASPIHLYERCNTPTWPCHWTGWCPPEINSVGEGAYLGVCWRPAPGQVLSMIHLAGMERTKMIHIIHHQLLQDYMDWWPAPLIETSCAPEGWVGTATPACGSPIYDVAISLRTVKMRWQRQSRSWSCPAGWTELWVEVSPRRDGTHITKDEYDAAISK
jgi:hypothetical protein